MAPGFLVMWKKELHERNDFSWHIGIISLTPTWKILFGMWDLWLKSNVIAHSYSPTTFSNLSPLVSFSGIPAVNTSTMLTVIVITSLLPSESFLPSLCHYIHTLIDSHHLCLSSVHEVICKHIINGVINVPFNLLVLWMKFPFASKSETIGVHAKYYFIFSSTFIILSADVEV